MNEQQNIEPKKDTLTPEQEQDIITLLKTIYQKCTIWDKFQYADDGFSENIKAAAQASTSVREFLNVLCDSLSISSVPLGSELIERLDIYANLVLRSLRKEPIYYVIKVSEARA
jgi:rubrerythrin